MLNLRLLGRGMSERCERVFQQTTTNSDVATNRCHDDAARPLVGAVLGVFSVILKWQVSGQIKKKNSFLIFGRRGRSFMQWVWPSIPTATRGECDHVDCYSAWDFRFVFLCFALLLIIIQRKCIYANILLI